MVFHVLNRGNARDRVFEKERDYGAFEELLAETMEKIPIRLLAYCLLPNHWHLVLWPHGDGDLGRFMQRLTTTHVRRWHLQHQSVGTGHLYQGTYKSFAIQSDEHLYTVLRYVERNAVRPSLVDRAEAWRWSSLGPWLHPGAEGDKKPSLSAWPLDRPKDWLARVNRALTKRELEAVRVSVLRGRPFGSAVWQKRTARRLGLEFTFRPRGRPRKAQPRTRC